MRQVQFMVILNLKTAVCIVRPFREGSCGPAILSLIVENCQAVVNPSPPGRPSPTSSQSC